MLDLWWGIMRRLTVAVIERRPITFIECRVGQEPLSIMSGTFDDLDMMATEAVRHSNEAHATHKPLSVLSGRRKAL